MKVYISPSSQNANMYSGMQNVSEEDVCRRIAKTVETALQRCGVETKMSKLGASLAEKCGESDVFMPDVHLAIHTNAGGGDGTLVLCHKSRTSNSYVKAVYEALAKLTPTADDGIRVSNVYEIRNTKALCVFVEVEFHDNADLAKWIVDNVDSIGETLAESIVKTKGIPWKQQTSAEVKEEPIKVSGGNGWFVSVGYFKSKDNAERYVKTLNVLGIPAIVKPE